MVKQDLPSYLDEIDTVAQTYAGVDPTLVGYELKKAWDHLEMLAKSYSYDVFYNTSDLHKALSHLLTLLYSLADVETSADMSEKDTAQIRVKDAEYGASWCRRGGPNAFFMFCRKWDRIETAMNTQGALGYLLKTDTREEGIRDDLGDLRRYLILVLAWRKARDAETVF